MASRDEILEFADALLDAGSFADYGPMGLQVVGTPEVRKIVCSVSASVELFGRAAEAGAQMVLVHHGILWDNEPRTIDRRMKGRLKALFDNDLNLVAYHLALDAHPEIGNNALLAQSIGLSVEKPFGGGEFGLIGLGSRYPEPIPVHEFTERVASALERKPLVFEYGPQTITRVAIVAGGGGIAGLLPEAANQGYDAFLTGEPAEPTMMAAKELGIHFVAAGHYATERFGITALTERIARRFSLEWEFVDLPTPV